MKLSQALRLLLVCLGLFGASTAQAVISCTATASTVQATYFANDPSPNDATWSVTTNCIRSSSDPTSTTYRLRVNNGLYAAGGSNQASDGGTGRIKYDFYRTAPGTDEWANGGTTDFEGTISFGTALSASLTLPFYSRIPAQQNVAAAIFTDTVGLNLRYHDGSGHVLTDSTIGVSINNTSLCLLTSPPTQLTFNYTSFQTTAATASSPYTVRCTLNETYTMTLDAGGGTLLNLDYTLTLSNPGGRTGTGMPENFTIDGSIAAGQAGTCATGVCTSAPQTRTLTITY